MGSHEAENVLPSGGRIPAREGQLMLHFARREGKSAAHLETNPAQVAQRPHERRHGGGVVERKSELSLVLVSYSSWRLSPKTA